MGFSPYGLLAEGPTPPNLMRPRLPSRPSTYVKNARQIKTFYAKQTQSQQPQNHPNPLPQKALRKNLLPPDPKKQTQFKPNPTQSHRPNQQNKSNPTQIRYPLHATRYTTPGPKTRAQIRPNLALGTQIRRKNLKKPQLFYAKQTQSQKLQNQPKSLSQKGLRRFPPPRKPKKQTQFKPNSRPPEEPQRPLQSEEESPIMVKVEGSAASGPSFESSFRSLPFESRWRPKHHAIRQPRRPRPYRRLLLTRRRKPGKTHHHRPHGPFGSPYQKPSLFPKHSHRPTHLSHRLPHLGQSRRHRPDRPAAGVRFPRLPQMDEQPEPQLHPIMDLGARNVEHQGKQGKQAPYRRSPALGPHRARQSLRRQAQVRPKKAQPRIFRPSAQPHPPRSKRRDIHLDNALRRMGPPILARCLVRTPLQPQKQRKQHRRRLQQRWQRRRNSHMCAK